MFKRIFVIGLLILAFAGGFLGIFDPDLAWARRVTYYLGQWSSSSTKTFLIDDYAGADTTAVFTLMENMVFLLNPSQANDSVFFKVKLRLLPRDYADSTDWFVDPDSAWVTKPGPQLLHFTHFKSGADSSNVIVPPLDYGCLLLSSGTDSLNGDSTRVKIRLMGATEGDF